MTLTESSTATTPIKDFEVAPASSMAAEIQWLSRNDINWNDQSPKWTSEEVDPILESIRERGIDNPLIVRKLDPALPGAHYEIVDGKARWISALILGIKIVPAIVVEMSDSEAHDHRRAMANNKLLKRMFDVGLDQSTELLCVIARMMENERALHFKIDELDRIADGLEMEDDSILWDRSYWFDNFLPSLNWWKDISDILLGSKDTDYKFLPEPAFAHHCGALAKLLNDVLAAFSLAWQEGCYFSDYRLTENGEATRELLKRYRLFTRYVGTFAMEIWPDVNLKGLLNRA